MKRKLITGFFALTIALSVCLLGIPQPLAAQSPVEVHGIATMNVGLVNVYGQSQGTRTYQTNVSLIFDKPLDDRETNPFHLTIQSTPLVNNPGEFSIYSAMSFTDNTGDNVFLQYWTYQAESRADSVIFAGELTNNQTSVALATNGITIPVEIAPNLVMPSYLSMANGTTIEGELSDTGVRIWIQGNTTNLAHPFEILIEV